MCQKWREKKKKTKTTKGDIYTSTLCIASYFSAEPLLLAADLALTRPSPLVRDAGVRTLAAPPSFGVKGLLRAVLAVGLGLFEERLLKDADERSGEGGWRAKTFISETEKGDVAAKAKASRGAETWQQQQQWMLRMGKGPEMIRFPR